MCSKWHASTFKALFCSNFVFKRGIWEACRTCYCAKCYQADPNVHFHINKPEDDEGIVWKRKTDDDIFITARNGDNLITPFQCDQCWFRNLQKRSPNPKSQADTLLLAFIRRVNLDALWSRSPKTVSASITGIKKIIATSQDLNFNPPLESLGPWPVGDEWGFRLAITILKASQQPGRTSKTHSQYDSIRKIASAYSNHYQASKRAASETWVMRSDFRNTYFTDCYTRSEFFTRFNEGLKDRMGREVKGDIPLDYKILHEILFSFEKRVIRRGNLS